MDDDWDLHAVVRSCSSTTSTSTAATTTATETSCGGQECNISGSQDLFFEPRKDSFIEGLHDLLKPFLPKQQFSPKTNLPVSPHSVLGRFQDLSSHHPQVIKQFPHQKQELFSVVNASKPTPRSKKRKNHLKRVCHIPAESLSSDMWSWRKYGQKPIKGSPYPRGYYRCSTSKGCMARKQVERNRSDPGMFIVTYTGEHNHPMPTHRNSLAGSTRHKPTSDDSKKHEMSPEKMEEELDDDEEEDDDFSPSKMALDDDFFAGLEDFAGECLSDPIKTDLEFPWLGNTAATTATTTTTAAEGGS